MELILASTSPYRRALLARLGLPFQVQAPEVDESPREHEAAEDLVLRLAREKAQAVARSFPDAFVIGGDQVIRCQKEVLGKPGTLSKAREQLQLCQGQQVDILNGLCVVGPQGFCEIRMVPYHVQLRAMDEASIHRYLEREQPLDCAGSIRSEGLGITLIERMWGDDPNALMGLPLLTLTQILRQAGFSLP